MFVRLAGHFHGWHDHVAFAGVPGAITVPDGILPDIVEHAIVCPPDEMGLIETLLETRRDIAAVIVEPTGASFGHVPLPSGALAKLREITRRHDVLLIFDEVITGFRCAPGGAQQVLGIEPDMATLAKIVAGGYPGGAPT
jgi:glutamate-1-semialdehyde 2,1-aminomutase